MFITKGKQTVNMDNVSSFFVSGTDVYFCGIQHGYRTNSDTSIYDEQYVDVFTFENNVGALEAYTKIVDVLEKQYSI